MESITKFEFDEKLELELKLGAIYRYEMIEGVRIMVLHQLWLERLPMVSISDADMCKILEHARQEINQRLILAAQGLLQRKLLRSPQCQESLEPQKIQ